MKGIIASMALKLACGQTAPDFSLPDVFGVTHQMSDFRGQIAMLNFWSAECPWSARTDRELSTQLNAWAEQVRLIPIASNANEPVDRLLRVAQERVLPLLLLDQNQVVADLYGAQTTPHLFVIDQQGILRYQGSYNDVSFRQRFPTRHYLVEAIEALLAGKLPDPEYTAPYGCTIVRFK